jgi:hypothetical protein
VLKLLTVSTALVAAAGLALASPAPARVPTSAATLTTQGPAQWTTADYDGVALTKDAPDLDELPAVHGVYVYPSDQPSRFADYAAYFQAEQRRASSFLVSATGMAFRWDERRSADGTRLLHDITVVRSKATLRSLSSTRQFSLVGDALKAAGLTDPDKKYYVWLDAKSENCGQAQGMYDQVRGPQNKAEASSYAVSYRPNTTDPLYSGPGGWCNPVIHELSHGLGAVNPSSPNYDSGGHCKDDPQDILCTISSSPGTYDRDAPRTYDYGNDDYLDPAADVRIDDPRTLRFWTVNLSRFLCPRSAADKTVPDCAQPNRPQY